MGFIVRGLIKGVTMDTRRGKKRKSKPLMSRSTLTNHVIERHAIDVRWPEMTALLAEVLVLMTAEICEVSSNWPGSVQVALATPLALFSVLLSLDYLPLLLPDIW